MPLQPIAKDVWGHEEDVRMPGGPLLPCRATIVRLASGELLVHSPLAIDDATAKEIDALGDVRYLVAPNCVHWMFVAAAKDRYPKARVFAAPGLEKKLGDIAFDPLPEDGRVDGIGESVAVRRIEGAPYMTEHVFLHEPSRSLIVADLMFNVHACKGWRMKLFFRIVGVWGKTAQSRFWRFLVKDRERAARSASAVLDWDFERIVVAHGTVVEDDARERARRALAWMTSGARPLLGTGSVIA